ncbi:MAG: hypothetical protein IIB16_01760 [Chloroflexi bacterium]|nr:hypothetical protein [Chloroflexota bacterium]
MSQALFFAARAFVAATVAAVFILGIACDSGTSGASEEPGPDIVRGAILRVESLSLTELGVLEIRDDAGKVWTFEARGKRFALFTPSHLNEHQVLGLKVAVHYHREADSLIIDDITD